jgi:AcrR family transcriptional regulator
MTIDAPARRRRRKTSDIRASILEAAATEFSARGYSGATTAAIAKRSGVAENQIFRHFTSKADLFKASIFDPLNEKFAAFNITHFQNVISGKEPETADFHIRTLCQFITGQKRELLALVRSNADDLGDTTAIGKINALAVYFQVGDVMLHAKRGPDFKNDPQIVNRISFATIFASIMFGEWLFPKPLDDDALSAVLTEYVMHGLDSLKP